VLRKRLAGVALDRPMPAGSYTPESSAAIYRELVAQAAIALRTGHSVIADAVFARSEERAAIAQAARQAGVRLDGLWLQAPADALKARVAARRGDASDATPLVVERQLAYAVQDMEWPVLSTAGPLPAVAEAARPLLGL
jgi:predicted kinase